MAPSDNKKSLLYHCLLSSCEENIQYLPLNFKWIQCQHSFYLVKKFLFASEISNVMTKRFIWRSNKLLKEPKIMTLQLPSSSLRDPPSLSDMHSNCCILMRETAALNAQKALTLLLSAGPSWTCPGTKPVLSESVSSTVCLKELFKDNVAGTTL